MPAVTKNNGKNHAGHMSLAGQVSKGLACVPSRTHRMPWILVYSLFRRCIPNCQPCATYKQSRATCMQCASWQKMVLTPTAAHSFLANIASLQMRLQQSVQSMMCLLAFASLGASCDRKRDYAVLFSSFGITICYFLGVRKHTGVAA